MGGQYHASAASPSNTRAVPSVQDAGRSSGPVWMDPENLTPTGFRAPDWPACSNSLYRLRYSCRPIWGSKVSYEVRASMRATWRHMERGEGLLHTFPSSALNGSKWWASRPGYFTPMESATCTHGIGWSEHYINIFPLLMNRTSIVHSIAQSLYRMSWPVVKHSNLVTSVK
jgi:hypothetical protein